MESFSTLISLAVLFLNIKITLQQQSFYSGLKDVKIANLFRLRGYRLSVSPLASLEFPDEIKCLTSCVKTDGCYIVNTKKETLNENVMCELLNRTRYHYPENLTSDGISSHWYTKVTTIILYNAANHADDAV